MNNLPGVATRRCTGRECTLKLSALWSIQNDIFGAGAAAAASVVGVEFRDTPTIVVQDMFLCICLYITKKHSIATFFRPLEPAINCYFIQ